VSNPQGAQYAQRCGPAGAGPGRSGKASRRTAPRRHCLTGRLLAGFLTALLAAGCGLLSAGDSRGAAHRSRVTLSEDPGWEGTVRIDSVRWLPAMPLEQPDPQAQELEGDFSARFANMGSRRVQVRYQLRFYDEDAVLLDDFFPFNQPVVLDSLATRTVSGQFRLDLSAADLDLLATMELAARVAAPEQ
jgi:hypothetical protein